MSAILNFCLFFVRSFDPRAYSLAFEMNDDDDEKEGKKKLNEKDGSAMVVHG